MRSLCGQLPRGPKARRSTARRLPAMSPGPSGRRWEVEPRPKWITRATSGQKSEGTRPARRAARGPCPPRRGESRIKRAELEQDVARRGDAGAREPDDPGRPLEPPRLCSGQKPGGLQRARDDRADPGPRADRRATGRGLARTVGLQHARPGERAPLERVARELVQAAVDQFRVGVEENGRLALGGLDAAVRSGANPACPRVRSGGADRTTRRQRPRRRHPRRCRPPPAGRPGLGGRASMRSGARDLGPNAR